MVRAVGQANESRATSAHPVSAQARQGPPPDPRWRHPTLITITNALIDAHDHAHGLVSDCALCQDHVYHVQEVTR